MFTTGFFHQEFPTTVFFTNIQLLFSNTVEPPVSDCPKCEAYVITYGREVIASESLDHFGTT